jgi:Kef-type K+ transport system membrane component KefB
MLNSIQLFGVVLLGGLGAGELFRRLFHLPRAMGYIVFGLVIGQSGFDWITPYHIGAAQLFVDLALGLILFELGYNVPPVRDVKVAGRAWVGVVVSLVAGGLIMLALLAWGFSPSSAFFAAALCVITSPSITIATCSDIGAKGDKTSLLFTMVAISGCVAFVAISLAVPLLDEYRTANPLSVITEAMQKISGSLILGAACAGLVLAGADRLGRRPEHQHLLILGTIVLGLGTATYLDVSVLMPMLVFGYITRGLDREKRVVAIRIVRDARIFLVVNFVLAGAALDAGELMRYWPGAVVIATARFAGHLVAVYLFRNALGLTARTSYFLSLGLQPMSSIALVLLINTQTLYSGIDPALTGTLLATILILQLLGPLATELAVKGFGEATRLKQGCAFEETKSRY